MIKYQYSHNITILNSSGKKMDKTESRVVSDICESMDRFGYAIGHQMLDVNLLRKISQRTPDYYKRDHARFGKDFLQKINEAEVVRKYILNPKRFQLERFNSGWL